MRYNELMEVTDEYEMKQAHKYAQKIRMDCEYYLRSKNADSNLVRGDHYTGQKYAAWDQDFTVMRDRRRIYSHFGTAQLIHDYLDDEGFKATRLRGKFCYKVNDLHPSNAINQASKRFGKSFAVFPVGTDWEIMYMDGLGNGGDYGNDKLIALAQEDYAEFFDLDNSIFSSDFPDDATVMDWYLSTVGDKIFHKGQNIETMSVGHEAVLYSPKVHMVDAMLIAPQEVQKTLYKGIN